MYIIVEFVSGFLVLTIIYHLKKTALESPSKAKGADDTMDQSLTLVLEAVLQRTL